MIPTYNCFKNLESALKSVLLQDAGPEKMQIEVIDDYSTDGNVAALVQDLGKGRIAFFQQPFNIGSLRNFESCINRARGKYIHLLHGDDMVKPGFYTEIEHLFSRYPNAGAAFTSHIFIDENGRELGMQSNLIANESGILEDTLYKLAQCQEIQPPAIVVKRNVYEKLGSFYLVNYGEDWEMWTRIAAHFPMAYSPNRLALYRVGHTSNITYRSYETGQNIKDILKVVHVIQGYLPKKYRRRLKRQALINYSVASAKISYSYYNINKKIAFTLARGALRLSLNRRTLYWVSKLYIVSFFSHFRR